MHARSSSGGTLEKNQAGSESNAVYTGRGQRARVGREIRRGMFKGEAQGKNDCSFFGEFGGIFKFAGLDRGERLVGTMKRAQL